MIEENEYTGMDLERSISGQGSGIDEGYSFSQTNKSIEISFPIPPGCDALQISSFFDPSKKSICYGLTGQPPVICGILWDTASIQNETLYTNVYRIIFNKHNENTWPIFISSPSSQGIDPKSEFMLGVLEDTQNCYSKALTYYQQSASNGFLHAKLLLADNYLSVYNNYNLPHDPSLAANLYLEVFSSPNAKQLRTPDLAIHIFHLLESLNRSTDLREFLEKNIEFSQIRFEYAKLLSPLSKSKYDRKFFNPEIAVKHLLILEKEKNLDAMELLAEHFDNGCGITKNREKSKELKDEIKKIDPKRYIQEKNNNFAKNMIVSSLIITGIGIATFLVLKKRSH